MGKLTKITFAVVWFILASLITYKTYYIVDVINDTIDTLAPLVLIKVLFYVGLAIVWIAMVLGVPVYTIINEYKEEAQI